MKLLAVCIFVCIAAVSADTAAKCTSSNCQLSKDCRCSDANSPFGDNFSQYPQLVSLTFDEAVTQDLVEHFWKPLLFDRLNPDKEPIGGTFYVPHEFSDYVKVNELYNNGFEIGVHSVTKNHLQSYWRKANESVLYDEFAGQKTILHKFANIPETAIKGVRTPQLQLNGDATFNAYVKAGLEFDSSWPTLPTYPLFPYTLEFQSTQLCLLGAKCPNSSFPKFWVLPIIDLRGDQKECNTLATCGINGTAQVISDWLLGEVNNIRNRNRAPITLLVNSYWFNQTENSYQALEMFFDKAEKLNDVFFVSQSQVVKFMKNPVKTKDFKTKVEQQARCQSQTCIFPHDKKMRSCTTCPDVYPWLGNPEGKKL